jgi:ATP-dependent protease HslVU (ClpYQ) peptidase subunit
MTTIVAIQGDGYALLGTDSRISSFDSSGMAYQITTLGAGSSKLGTNGKYVLGAAGDVRAINILHHAFTPPTPPATAKGKRLDAFITNKFVPALRECFETQGYAMPDNEEKEHLAQQNSTIVVAIHGIIYVIESDYGWTSDSNGIYAVGTGAPYALGALNALLGNRSVDIATGKRIVTKALSIAGKFDPYTGSPFTTVVQSP